MGEKITETWERTVKDDSLGGRVTGDRVVKVEKLEKRPAVTETKTTTIITDED